MLQELHSLSCIGIDKRLPFSMARLCELNFKLLETDLSIFLLNTSTYFKENLRKKKKEEKSKIKMDIS